MTYAFAAAGTGGHVFPALAVADALVERGVTADQIVFFGGDRMEAEAVPAAGYRFVPVEVHGLRRSLSKENLELPGMVWRAAKVMTEAMRAAGTRVVAVFGGYVSGPAAIAAARAKATLLVHEQNAVPGLANRLISRRAATTFIAFPAAAGMLRNAQLVGNPLRADLARFDRGARRAEARRHYDLPPDVTVLGVLGGSLGAQVINDVVARIADDADADQLAIVHLTGPSHHEAVSARAARSGIVWRTVAFEADMARFYAAVDLVLARSGALTVSELAATGTPAVLVPLEAVGQEGNADHLARGGGAVVIAQQEIDRVPVVVQQIVLDPERRRVMGSAAAELARPEAAAVMAAVMSEAADG
jgi:UDP-N-acetylglucosamine--N-acetylmuramyl-(pentapeptide) pyrophosphoryl-undecaprenol N-acetylglucosamine transferase